MFLKLFLLSTFLTGTAFSQDVFSVYSRLAPPSPSSGNGGQAGIGFDGVVQVNKHALLDLDASIVKEPKSYVGNGWSVRAQAEGLIGGSGVFVGGGITSARHSNSQYVKSQYQPLLSAHYRPRSFLDLYGSYLLPAMGNENDVQGWRVGYRGTFQSVPKSKYGLFIQAEFTQFRFLTAFNDQRKASGLMLGLGISRVVEKIR
jgi:hypothetical protein